MIRLLPVLLLAGCMSTHVEPLAYTDTVTMDVCHNEPHTLDATFDAIAATHGIVNRWHVLDADLADDDPAMLFSRVTDCDWIVLYRGTAAHALVCVLLACQAGHTYAAIHRPDAVMVLYLETEGIARHEWLHAMGCDHDDEAATCAAQIGYRRSQIASYSG